MTAAMRDSSSRMNEAAPCPARFRSFTYVWGFRVVRFRVQGLGFRVQALKRRV
jgi:hypothetical protein